MPNTKTAKRELRVAERRHTRNKSIKSSVKTLVTSAENIISSNDLESARAAVGTAISALDREAEKKIVHRNNAARRKSRLMKKLNSALAKPKAEAPKE